MEEIAKDILIRASQGDTQAFEDVYKASSGFVYNVALRIVNNREDALEVAQDVFMIIYHKLKTFRFESSFKTWAYRITANSAINFAKKSSRAKTVPYEDSFERGRRSSMKPGHGWTRSIKVSLLKIYWQSLILTKGLVWCCAIFKD